MNILDHMNRENELRQRAYAAGVPKEHVDRFIAGN